MRKALAILGSVTFLVIAPGFIAGLAPWWITHWKFGPPLFGVAAVSYGGWLLLAAGLCVVLDSFARFALEGLGTPAPVFPTRHLVVSGLYRYVRNPMYWAVVAMILGQGLLLGSVPLLEYGGFIWLCFHLFVLAYEEPTLKATFGPEYQAFCAAVPRWIPRTTAWADNPR